MTLTRIFVAYVLACAVFIALGAVVIGPWFAVGVTVQAVVQIIPAAVLARIFSQ